MKGVELSEQNSMFNLTDLHLSDDKFRRLLIAAQRHYLQENYPACIQHLALLVVSLFASRLEPVGRLVRRALPSPESIRLVRTDLGTRVILSRKEFVESDCSMLASYVYSLSSIIGGSAGKHYASTHQNTRAKPIICKRSLAETLALRIETYLTRCAINREFSIRSRIKLSMLTTFYFFLLQRIPQVRNHLSLEMIRYSVVFHEPLDNVERLLKAHYFHSKLSLAKHANRLRYETTTDAPGVEFYWPERSDYQKMVSASNESRVLTTIHMGDVIGAFRSISELAPPGRRAVIPPNIRGSYK